jgi:hypothetical protein
MRYQFHGSLRELKAIIRLCGYKGSWKELKQQDQFRAKNGAVLNWWVSSGTIFLQGKTEKCKDLGCRLELLLEAVSKIRLIDDP